MPLDVISDIVMFIATVGAADFNAFCEDYTRNECSPSVGESYFLDVMMKIIQDVILDNIYDFVGAASEKTIRFLRTRH